MLTPIDIQNHVLKSTMGGYNKKETDEEEPVWAAVTMSVSRP